MIRLYWGLSIFFSVILFFLPDTAYSKKQIIVGVYDNRPLVYKNANDEYAGLGIEILEHIADKEGWNLKYIHGTWPQCLSRLKTGETDIQVLIGYTKERDKVYDYTQESVFVAWGQVYTTPDIHVKNILDLKGKKIALYKDSLLSIAFKDLLNKFDIKCQLIEVEDYKAILSEMTSGNVDAGVFNRTFASSYGKKSALQKTPVVFSPTPLFYAVKEGKYKELTTAIDKYLKEMKDEQDSIYYQLLEKSFGDAKRNLIPEWVKWVFVLGSGVLVIIGFISLFLKRQVEHKTAELQAQNIVLEKEIIERKQSEKALQNSESKYRELFELSPIGLALCRMDGQLVSVNPAYAEITGYSVAETLDLSYWEITPEKYAEDEKYQLDQIKKKGRYGPYEKEYIHKSGHLVPVRLNGMLVIRDGEQLIWSSVEDITALKKAEQESIELLNQLRQSHKMEAIGTLAGGIAHDFNNLLAIMLGYAEMSLEDIPYNSPAKENIDQIVLAANRASELVGHILTFSRKGQKKRFPVQIHLLVQEVLKLLRATIPTTVKIEQNINPRCGNILADPTEIQQVVMNLCTNAAQAMDKNGGILKIELKSVNIEEKENTGGLKPGKYVCLTISDSGTGISKNNIEKIFDPYFTTKKVGEGSGMGLAVVIGIVKNHEGTITVNSIPGKGTVFSTYFPQLEKTIHHQPEKTDAQQPTGNEKILVVDDEKNVARLCKLMLEKLGYSVVTESNSIEALQLFKNDPSAFDLIITDYTMPDLTGDEFAKKIFEIKKDVPVVICTGYSSKIDAEKAKALGISGFMMKPITKKELAKTIRRILDQ